MMTRSYCATLFALLVSCLIPTDARASCSAELMAVAQFGFQSIPGDQMARQVYEIRKSQARAALSACQQAEREATSSADEKRRADAAQAAYEFSVAQQNQQRAMAEQEVQQAEAVLNSAVAQAVMQGRCEAAKEIALSRGRMDLAEQALKLCKPYANDLRALAVTGHSGSEPKTPPELINKMGILYKNDYPILAAAERRAGISVVKILVRRSGLASNCFVISSSGSKDIDDVTCWAILTRGQFTPAKNDKGINVDGYYKQSVRWSLD